MIVSIHQPAYLPWMGYFDKISKSDIHVYLDTVQFEKGSFTNRNKINNSWLTIPIKRNGFQNINEIEISGYKWIEKHLKTISYKYGKTERYGKLKSTYSQSQKLSSFLFSQLRFWLKELDIQRDIAIASHFNFKGKKSDLILDICKQLKATTYLSGICGKDYLEEEIFKQNGVSIVYQEPKQWDNVLDCYLGGVAFCD